MFDFSDSVLEKIAVHQVGNKAKQEFLRLSSSVVTSVDQVVGDLLHKYFLSPFKRDAYFSFTHETDLNHNVVFSSLSRIFDESGNFFDESKRLASYLYEKSNHPNIKSGEFYLVYFQNCVVDDESVDAIGLFKSENKDTYLRVFQRNDNFEIDYENGININKLDKGCLIFNTEKEKGYKVCIVDKTNTSAEALYWKDDFLKLEQRHDDFYHTQNYLDMCKGFVDDVFNKDNDVDRADQILMMNKSMEYFKSKEKFDEKEFEEEVMEHPEIIGAFSDYKSEYLNTNNIEPSNGFDISKSAYKENKKYFKSILKLDKNFHVYIHGNRSFIEKGFDSERHMNYYKLYFYEED